MIPLLVFVCQIERCQCQTGDWLNLDDARAKVAKDASRPPEADGVPPQMPFNTADVVRLNPPGEK
jgi:hypothetical protein